MGDKEEITGDSEFSYAQIALQQFEGYAVRETFRFYHINVRKRIQTTDGI